MARYVVLDLLGAGGMGAVYAAYDPDLDRKVALKLLRLQPFGSHGAEHAGDRVVREAQAMARLNHPNVITVHDVGTVGDGVFIAMEHLDAGTLAQRSDGADRSHVGIVSLYLQAGRGLAAAHAAGLVHGDFKPDNVLLGSDGRVRVSDFGLAREHEPQTPLQSRPDGDEVSRTGAFVGTPAYMAPEQHLGARATVRSDQFSFCVALYEALCGRRPWSADTVAGLCLAVTEESRRSCLPRCRRPCDAS